MRGVLAVLAVLYLLAGCASVGPRVTDLRQGQTGWVSYPSSRERIDLSGELVLPTKASAPVPAMIIAHASGGLDARNARWAAFLQEHGLATFQIDYFGPRGVSRHSPSQPIPVHDALDAYRLLATHPKIDPTRIGIIGFSRGGDIAVATANAAPEQTGGHGFAAHVALYPLCFSLIPGRKGSGAPLLILVGNRDDLVSVAECERLVKGAQANGHEAVLRVYEGAAHGWDGDFSGTWFHPALGRSYGMYPDQAITQQSRKDVLAFLKAALKF